MKSPLDLTPTIPEYPVAPVAPCSSGRLKGFAELPSFQFIRRLECCRTDVVSGDGRVFVQKDASSTTILYASFVVPSGSHTFGSFDWQGGYEVQQLMFLVEII
jgi:hypothetical protein